MIKNNNTDNNRLDNNIRCYVITLIIPNCIKQLSPIVVCIIFRLCVYMAVS